MAKSKGQKETQVADLVRELQDAKSAIIIQMTGLKVKENWEFRRILRKEHVTLEVAKKTLLKIIFEKAGISLPVDDLRGTVAILVDPEDEARSAKLVSAFAKTHPVVELARGAVRMGDGWEFYDKQGVTALSKLESRPELLSKLLYLIGYPTSGFVRTLSAVPQKFVRTLQAIHDKKATS